MAGSDWREIEGGKGVLYRLITTKSIQKHSHVIQIERKLKTLSSNQKPGEWNSCKFKNV